MKYPKDPGISYRKILYLQSYDGLGWDVSTINPTKFREGKPGFLGEEILVRRNPMLGWGFTSQDIIF